MDSGGLPKTLKVQEGPAASERKVLIKNLDAQTTNAFVKCLAKHCNTIAWLFPGNTTDELQPVDTSPRRDAKGGGWEVC